MGLRKEDNMQKRPSILKYIVISALIFFLGILIAILAKIILVSDGGIFHLGAEQADMIAGLVEGAVGAIAAGFVLYQLKGEEIVEKRENEIHEAEFYQHFINYWLETDKLFITYPECRKNFYDDANVRELEVGSETYERVMGLAEYFDDLFRYSETEIDNLSEGNQSIPQDQIESYKVYISNMRKKDVFQYYREKYGSWVNSTE